MGKIYLIEENKLKELIENSLILEMLEKDGVDNWFWYGKSYPDIIKKYFPNDGFFNRHDLYDCVCKEIKDNYKEI